MHKLSTLCVAIGLTISLPSNAANYVYDDLNRPLRDMERQAEVE